MNLIRASACLAIASFACCSSLAQVLNVAGATTLQKRLLEPGADGLRAATGIDLKVAGINAGPGMLALFDGKVQAAAVADSLPESVASAMKAARNTNRSVSTMHIPLNLRFHELTSDRIVFIVNKDNPIGSLNKVQLKDIHTGKVRNWMEVGGPNLPITVVTVNVGGAIRGVIQRQIMDNADYALSAVTVPAPADELVEVSKTKGAISAVSEGFFKAAPGKTRLADAPAITRPLGLVTVGAPSADVKKVVDYFRSPAGQSWLR